MSVDKSNLPKAGADFSSLAIVFGTMFFYMWCITTWTAYKLGFQAALGKALFTLGAWKFYAPWGFIVWQNKFGMYPGTKSIFDTAWLVFLAGFGVIMIGLTILLGVIKRKLGAVKTHDAFSSDWADDIDVEYSGLLATDSWATKKELAALNKNK